MKTLSATALIGLLLAGCATTPFTTLPSTSYGWETAKGLCEVGDQIACQQLPYFPLLAEKQRHW